jgi:hypothetical protein
MPLTVTDATIRSPGRALTPTLVGAAGSSSTHVE